MLAVVFPGQGSQRPGMGADLAAHSVEAAEVFARISEAVGLDVLRLCTDSDEATLRQTENAQIALFACGMAAYRARGPLDVHGAAGHSVGEYAACVASGALSLEDGARLVRRRGELMATAGHGAMAAVLGLDRALVEEACREAGGIAVVANDNSPGQLVISGEPDAVTRSGEIAKAKGAKRVIPLNVSGAFHSPLMADAAKEMGQALRTVSLMTPTLRLYANVTAQPVTDGASLPDLLERQLSSQVRWTETIRRMVTDGFDTFIECGPGEVLGGLIRRIEPGVRTFSVQDSASLGSARGLPARG